MFRYLTVLALSFLTSWAAAQGSMWQANRFSSDLHQINPCGEVTNVISLASNGFNLRSVHQAPDGKLWVVNFITPTLTILNPDGTNIQNFPTTLGAPFDLDFDQNGEAWVSGGAGVEERDPNGNLLNTFVLPAPAPLGITVDANGNKWIAHRTGPPGSVSRIDAAGNITNFLLPVGSGIQPTMLVADFQGIGSPSNIWVVGDSGTNVVELDSTGSVVGMFSIGAGLFTIAVGPSQNIWVGSFQSGTIWELDHNTGAVQSSFTNLPNTLGLNFGSFGRLWVTTRVSFSGPVPSEVRRYDPASGAFEVTAVVGLGAQSAASTRFHQALVVDPLGDADQDGEPNFIEALGGTSPFDASSNTFASLVTTGNTGLGGLAQIQVTAGIGTTTFLAAGPSLAATPMSFGGVGGSFLLDPLTFLINPLTGLPILFTVSGSGQIPVPIPTNPSFVGVVLYVQGFSSAGGQTNFTNLACLSIF